MAILVIGISKIHDKASAYDEARRFLANAHEQAPGRLRVRGGHLEDKRLTWGGRWARRGRVVRHDIRRGGTQGTLRARLLSDLANPPVRTVYDPECVARAAAFLPASDYEAAPAPFGTTPPSNASTCVW